MICRLVKLLHTFIFIIEHLLINLEIERKRRRSIKCNSSTSDFIVFELPLYDENVATDTLVLRANRRYY